LAKEKGIAKAKTKKKEKKSFPGKTPGEVWAKTVGSRKGGALVVKKNK